MMLKGDGDIDYAVDGGIHQYVQIFIIELGECARKFLKRLE